MCLREFANELANPLIFRTVTDDERVFIGEQVGRVHIYFRNGSRLPDPFLDLQDLVLTSSSHGDERGFLGMALHPNFTSNQRLFVYYSIRGETREKIRISEFTVDYENPDKVNRTSERVLLEVGEPWWNHNGGEILFGVDGYLYAFIGDGGSGGDPLNNAQNKSTFLGKVIRIDVDNPDHYGSKEYGIPEDNPFINEVDALPEIYAYGVRNIWRCDVDDGHPDTGQPLRFASGK
ncbi:hypothetical protein CAPTEDRAFT_139254 [Capitella teleta]|uniref:Glucose/Sorbosone dehydrogenase domain-containing protein n=1 Tax=Capitella teleta TaxID=283909 RepID=R7VAE9_CAPTE|nr:hypothetical protein CAPTEDRAFT_139254 [Capitella teleta]|eukprot:ELU13311.1 hypothetical protein CAPTEDRAFT_139254 [Capitella teleta]